MLNCQCRVRLLCIIIHAQCNDKSNYQLGGMCQSTILHVQRFGEMTSQTPITEARLSELTCQTLSHSMANAFMICQNCQSRVRSPPNHFPCSSLQMEVLGYLGSMVERPFSLLFPHILSPVGPSQPWLPVLLDIEGNMWHVKVVVHPIVYNHAMISSEFLLSTLVSVVSSCLTSTIKSALYCCSKLNWNCSRFGLSF